MAKTFGQSGTLLDSSVPSLKSPRKVRRDKSLPALSSPQIRIMSTDVKCHASAYGNGRIIDKKPR